MCVKKPSSKYFVGFSLKACFQKGGQRGSNSSHFFKLMREEKIQITLKVGHHGSASKHYLNGDMAFCSESMPEPMMVQH